jgi:hypothetical protein
MPYVVEFNVVSKLVHRLVFGNPFLQETELLKEKFKHRLVSMPKLFNRCMAPVNKIGTLRHRIPMLANSGVRTMEIRALPDTGAGGNFLSDSFVCRKGLQLEKSDIFFLFPDGTMERSLGHTRLFLSFIDNPGEGSYVDFEVMEGCQEEAILGHDFIFENRIYSDKMHMMVDESERASGGFNLVICVRIEGTTNLPRSIDCAVLTAVI